MSDRRRWVCLDVGETLVDETRIWSLWADELGIPRLTFLAAFGVALERGGDYSDVFRLVGHADWREHMPSVLAAYGGLRDEDLYPDALRSLDALRELGYGLAVVANQPPERTQELRDIGVRADAIAMSGELGVQKPQPEFFQRALELMGSPDPGDVVYVGDRVDNDVRPSRAAGMFAVWLRRGPWGIIAEPPREGEALVVDSLDELVERIGGLWP